MVLNNYIKIPNNMQQQILQSYFKIQECSMVKERKTRRQMEQGLSMENIESKVKRRLLRSKLKQLRRIIYFKTLIELRELF